MESVKKIIKSRLRCGVCGRFISDVVPGRQSSWNWQNSQSRWGRELNSLLGVGVCLDCVREDHVQGNVNEILKSDGHLAKGGVE